MRFLFCLLALSLADDPTDAAGYFKRGNQRAAKGEFADAVKDFTEAIRLDPKNTNALYARGAAHFMQGKFAESVSDFDAQIKLDPKSSDGHWQRGISLYYAGKYEEGCKQFVQYENVSTTDVENAVWHFMCATKKDGIEKARKGILKIGKDARVPMAEVYELFKGTAKPDDVLKVAKDDKLNEKQQKAALFYAHLYIGIYYDLVGEVKQAMEHLELSSKHKINHYMGEVPRVHLEALKKKQDKK